MLTATDIEMVNAYRTDGTPVVLVTDPEGTWFITEQMYFTGGESLIRAHEARGDLAADVTRYAQVA